MIRRQLLKAPAYAGLFSYSFFGYDKPTFEGNVTAEDYAKVNPYKKCGIEGLKRMWRYDDFGSLSQELEVSIHTAFYCGFIGGLIGAFKNAKDAYTRFLETNMGTKYVSEIDAKKFLVDKVGLSVFRGLFIKGGKLGVFVFLYMITSSSVTVYRGKSGIVEFGIGGAFAGGLYKFWDGPRALFVGVSTGTLFGVLAGGITHLMFLAAGTSYQDWSDYQYKFIKDRERAFLHSQVSEFESSQPENALLAARKYDEKKDLFKENTSS